MSNIHFINVRTQKHEFCNMKEWVLMHAESFAALMITASKIMNIPVAFSMYGSDGDGYVVCDDEAYNNKFIVAHEEGHLELGHYKEGAMVNVDEHGILDDEEAEKAADRYAIERTKDPKSALDTLHHMMESMNDNVFKTKDECVHRRMELANRMLAIANIKI